MAGKFWTYARKARLHCEVTRITTMRATTSLDSMACTHGQREIESPLPISLGRLARGASLGLFRYNCLASSMHQTLNLCIEALKQHCAPGVPGSQFP